MKLSPSEGLSSSHAVFTGEVTDIEPNEATKFAGLEITLRVKQVWKGAPTDEIKVHTAGTSAACGYPFVKGTTYLVYSTRDEADPMRVSLCSRTAPIENAKEDLDFLGTPSHRFDDRDASRKSKHGEANRKDKCSMSPGNRDGAGFGLLALLLAGAALTMRRRYHLLAPTVLIASLFGCSTAPAKPALMANMAKGDVTVTQLRAMDYEYSARFSQLVAMCVTEIVAANDDKKVRERAYQWRMWAAPQARAAAFAQDPFAGLLELWVLAGQQRQYFTEGDGKNHFGDQQGCAPETTKKLEADAERIASIVVPEEALQRMTENVRTWVQEHPIEGQLFVRPTARADLAGLVPEATQGGLQAVGSIEETFRSLNDRITILTVQMPVEARWQAEYLTNSLFEERVQEPAESMLDAMETMIGFLDELEPILAAQTNALLAGVTAERIAVFDAVEEERTAILASIEGERLSIMNELDTQVSAATTKLDAAGKGLIDHFFVRLIEVLAVMGVVMFLTVLLVLVVLRKRGGNDD